MFNKMVILFVAICLFLPTMADADEPLWYFNILRETKVEVVFDASTLPSVPLLNPLVWVFVYFYNPDTSEWMRVSHGFDLNTDLTASFIFTALDQNYYTNLEDLIANADDVKSERRDF